MSDYLEHSDRARHHRQPRKAITFHWPADKTDPNRHEGDSASCRICHECKACAGSGVIVTNPEVLAFNPAALRDVTCPDCEGSGER